MVELKWNLQFHFNSDQFHFAIPISIAIPWLAISITIPELTSALVVSTVWCYNKHYGVKEIYVSIQSKCTGIQMHVYLQIDISEI